MAEQTIDFGQFLENVADENYDFVKELHEKLTEKGCKAKIKQAKNGHVLSYLRPDTGKTLANYVFRKKGMMIRIYASRIQAYEPFLETLPETMIKVLEKALPCKRLENPEDCSSRCPMGYIYTLRGQLYKKCRYGLLFLLNGVHNPYILQWLEKELEA